MKTLKDVVREKEPECVSDDAIGDVISCPFAYEYLRGHYNQRCEETLHCDDCWNQPYIPFEDEKSDRDKIIEGLKTMKAMCKFNTHASCDMCDISDLCEKVDIAFDGDEFIACSIEDLPEK